MSRRNDQALCIEQEGSGQSATATQSGSARMRWSRRWVYCDQAWSCDRSHPCIRIGWAGPRPKVWVPDA